jgi:Ca-activated chloride channel homolog
MSGHDPEFDTWLDAELRNVALPPDLAARLEMVPQTTDAAIDAALADVPIPPGLLLRLHEIAEPRQWRLRWQRVALAASILIAMWVAYAGAMVGMLLTMSEPRPEPPKTATLSSESLPVSEPPIGDFRRSELISEVGRSRDLAAFDPAEPAPGPATGQEIGLPSSPLDDTRDWLPGPDGRPRFDPIVDVTWNQWSDALGSQHVSDELPEPQEVVGIKPAGVVLPLVPINVEALRWNVHPLVSPAADSRLQTSAVPLGVDSASFELTRRLVAEGELPPRDKLATEEFLKAIDYHFPRPALEALSLSAAGGPSPFRQDGRKLLQFGVQARDLSGGNRPAARLILVVDVSGSMLREGRLEMARAALVRLADHLRAKDRVSLVAFSEDAEVLAEDLGGNDRQKLLSAIGSLSAKRSTNVGAGLRLAYAVAQRVADGPSRVVLLTDGLAELAATTISRIEERLADAARHGTMLDVVNLGPDLSGSASESAAPQYADNMLSGFTRSGGGHVYHAASADQISRSLLEIMTGKSQLVAGSVRLTVTFNPKAVAAYRLVGHEARSLVGLKPAPLEVDFYAGQSAIALYEVILLPGAKGEAATGELAWRGPKCEQRYIKVQFRAEQFPATLLQAPLSLQAAAVAAEAAEVLRGVPEVEPLAPFFRARPAGSLRRVIDAAANLDTRVRLEPSFAQFVAVLEQAEHAKPHKSLPKK